MRNTTISDKPAVKGFHTLWLIPLFIGASIFTGTTAHAAPKAKSKVAAKASAKASAKVAKGKVNKPVTKKALAKPPVATTKHVAVTRAPAQQRGPSSLSAGISDSQKSLEIRGQSRNLSMLLVLKNRHENIDFVKPRESYREEVPQTAF